MLCKTGGVFASKLDTYYTYLCVGEKVLYSILFSIKRAATQGKKRAFAISVYSSNKINNANKRGIRRHAVLLERLEEIFV